MVEAGGLRLLARRGGDGPTVVLLHGHPRTSSTWHRVAPLLVAQRRTVICLDLPGYGRSDKPAPQPDHRRIPNGSAPATSSPRCRTSVTMSSTYRAGLTIDYADELADRQSARRVRQPLMVLWSTLDDLEDLYGDPLGIWRSWADHVFGHGIRSPHHIAEHAPDELAAALGVFLNGDRAN